MPEEAVGRTEYKKELVLHLWMLGVLVKGYRYVRWVDLVIGRMEKQHNYHASCSRKDNMVLSNR